MNAETKTTVPNEEALSTHSVRMSQGTIDQLNMIKASGGFKNLDEALKALLTAYSMRNAKELSPSRADEISAFETLLHNILGIYIHSLNLYDVAKEDAERKVSDHLAAKDTVIDQLTHDLKAEREENAKREKVLTDEKFALESQVESLSTKCKTLAAEIEAFKQTKAQFDMTMRLEQIVQRLDAVAPKAE